LESTGITKKGDKAAAIATAQDAVKAATADKATNM